MVKRGNLIPMMTIFDAPDALQGLDQRTTTTISSQALLMMNSPIVRKYAEAFAARAGSVQSAYAIALSRNPTSEELSDSTKFVEEQSKSYGPDGTTQALADLCQVLLGLNEFIYID